MRSSASCSVRLLQEVQAFARTGNYDLVVGDGVLYVNESMDITPQVLSALQARAKTGGPAKPAPEARDAAGQAITGLTVSVRPPTRQD